jgi:ankyrin repeat protein
MVQLLLAAGADPLALSGDGGNAFHDAASYISSGAAETEQARHLRVPRSILEQLLNAVGPAAPAALAVRNARGQTPLHCAFAPMAGAQPACFTASLRDAVLLLLANGADVDAVDRMGDTPLAAAIGAIELGRTAALREEEAADAFEHAAHVLCCLLQAGSQLPPDTWQLPGIRALPPPQRWRVFATAAWARRCALVKLRHALLAED